MLNPFTHRKVLKDGVPGKAAIITMGALDRDAMSFNFPMTLQVYVEGWTPYEVHDEWWVNAKDTVALSGGWLPVRVDPDERDKVAIVWDELREGYERQEEARRQALAASGPVQDRDALGLGGLFGGANVTVQTREIDLTPGGQQGRQDDPITRLERLAALKASGVLTEEEFQQQKRRILDES